MADNVLDQARARLDGGKYWIKGGMRGVYDRVCLVGAISDVVNDFDTEIKARGFDPTQANGKGRPMSGTSGPTSSGPFAWAGGVEWWD